MRANGGGGNTTPPPFSSKNVFASASLIISLKMIFMTVEAGRVVTRHFFLLTRHQLVSQHFGQTLTTQSSDEVALISALLIADPPLSPPVFI